MILRIILRTYPKIRKPLFYIQKPLVFEYKKVKFPDFMIDTQDHKHQNIWEEAHVR
jgi:hypothetical protein